MQDVLQEGMQKWIQGTVDILRDLGHKDDDIKAAIMDKYNLSNAEIQKYF